jgi:hypothetical protein
MAVIATPIGTVPVCANIGQKMRFDPPSRRWVAAAIQFHRAVGHARWAMNSSARMKARPCASTKAIES